MQPRHTPSPAELVHLRPRNLHGAATAGGTLFLSALGVWLSTSGGLAAWMCGQVLLACAFVEWFVILHECGHETLFRSRRYNILAGTVAGFVALIPFRCWVRVHGRHHKWTGWQDLDPTTEALVPRPRTRAQRSIVNVCWRLWIPLFSVLYRFSNFWNLRRLAVLFPNTADRRVMIREAAVLATTYLALAVYAGPVLLGRSVGVALLLSLIAEDVLLLSQHTHLPQNVSRGAAVRPFPAIEQQIFTRSLRLPSWVSALLLHFDAHELHHMYPFVPGYLLRRVSYTPQNEIGWWAWTRRAKRLRGDVLLFQNRLETGWDI
jgi:omega-6 fatty acid desaturase (delta-12 desaturase)